MIEKRVHFLGIGGAGQSALAEVLLARGHQVSGCDVKRSAVTEALTAKGAEIFLDGHNPSHCFNNQLLVYTTRLSPEGESERAAAAAAGLRVLSRPMLLAELLAESTSLGVAGTHGKTTTTAMAGYLWREVGWNPTLLVGDGRSSRAGGEQIIAELDESDKSLTLHQPQIAVVTNVEFDHGDYYRDLDDVKATFASFLNGLPPAGVAVVCADDPWLAEQPSSARRLTYGFSEFADYRCLPDGTIIRRGERLGQLHLSVPGQHNLQNATAVVAAAIEMGLEPEVALAGLRGFTGARRRLEQLGSWRGVTIYDDYGHLPTEVRVTVAAARELPHQKLLLVFQPHRFSRYLESEEGFIRVFSESGQADKTLITEIYSAGEVNPGGVSARRLAQATGNDFAANLTETRAWIEANAEPGDLVLLMGAGNIREVGDEILA